MKHSPPVPISVSDYPFDDYQLFCAEEMSATPEKLPALEKLPACFITRGGYIEPAIGRPVLIIDDFDQPQIPSAGIFGLNALSENEALVQLHRCVTETGQLVVRTTDHLTDVWFAGVGDPESLFVEFFSRGESADSDGGIKCGMFSLQEAERLLDRIYRGAASQELLASGLSRLRIADIAQQNDDAGAMELVGTENG